MAAANTKLSIVTICGNRLEQLKGGLISFLAQEGIDFEIVVSVYADRDGTADYIRTRYPQEVSTGKIKIVETPEANIFNYPRAGNAGVLAASGKVVWIIEADCTFSDTDSAASAWAVYQNMGAPIASFSYWGQLMVPRAMFLEVGGYDPELGDGWAPVDFDLIPRIVVNWGCSYRHFAPLYRFSIEPAGDHFQLQWLEDCRHPQWIQSAPRDPSWNHNKYLGGKYYTRIGGMKESKVKLFEATLEYFQKNSPLIQLRYRAPQLD